MTTPPDLLLGPLTTIFAAPAECNRLTISVAVDSSGTTSYAPFIYPRLFSSVASTCFPSGYPLGNAALTTTYGPYNYYDEHVYYNPGICPRDWTQYHVAQTSSSPAAETTAFCCPPNFYATSGPWRGSQPSTYCAYSLSSTEITTIAYTGDGAPQGSSIPLTFTSRIIPAPAIWIRYKDSDFSILPATTTTTSSSSVTTSTPQTTTLGRSTTPTTLQAIPPSSAQQSQTSQSPLPTTTPPNTLSTGTKIGLGIGLPALALLASSIIAILCIRNRRRRRRRRQDFCNPVLREDTAVSMHSFADPPVGILPELEAAAAEGQAAGGRSISTAQSWLGELEAHGDVPGVSRK